VLASFLLVALAQVGIADELTPAFPDTAFADAVPRAVEGAARSHPTETGRGMESAIHIFVQAADGETVEISVASTQAELAPPAVSIARLHAVPVEENTGIVSRTELFDGETNPHVIRRAPFFVFDPIEPLPIRSSKSSVGSSALAEQGGVAFRLSWTPESAGDQQFVIRVQTPAGSEEFRWQVRVHDFELPTRKDWGFAYTNWFSPEQIATRHDLELWTPSYWVMLRRYADLMAHGGQDTFWLRWQDFFAQGAAGRWNLDHDRLERYVRTFLDAGFDWIEGAPIAYRPEGDWSRDWLELRFGKLPATGKEGQEALRQVASQLRSAFRTNDWSRQWIQHIADEPTNVNAADYRKLSNLLRKHLPGVPIVEATMTRELTGAIDIWCPQVHKYQANRDFFLERQAAGDQVWTYTCLVPGGPWLNRLLDQERLRQVYLGWAGAHFDTQGFLHWGLNHYKADPFEQSVVDHPAQTNTKNKLPAGDTHVIYPGKFMPLSSTRFEAHRIGLEDLAMLRALQSAHPERAAELITQVFRGYDDWEASVASYRATRAQLLIATAEAFQTE
jgi:Glycoside hydrolase 123, catalytic domain